jgi:hypothetical protein
MLDKYDEFIISDHASLADSLNKISDDLVTAKWYFIATISAIGFAYKFIMEDIKHLTISGLSPSIGDNTFSAIFMSNHIDGNEAYFVFAICLVGNIILWLVSEYALSHGFLFRYIQGKAAVIETMFNPNNDNHKKEYRKMINNPYDTKRFIKLKNTRLKFSPDQTIPDQFVPLYWASTWLMVINSAFGYFVVYKFCKFTSCANSMFIIPLFILTSTLFIRKLLHYYLYKFRQLLDKCEFIINTEKNMEKNKYFYYPNKLDIVLGFIAIVCACLYNYGFFDNIYSLLSSLILWGLVGYCLVTILALLLQVLIYFLNADSLRIEPTLVLRIDNEYDVIKEYRYRISNEIVRALSLICMVI